MQTPLSYHDMRPGLDRLERAIWLRSCDVPTYEDDRYGIWYGRIRLYAAIGDGARRVLSNVVTVR